MESWVKFLKNTLTNYARRNSKDLDPTAATFSTGALTAQSIREWELSWIVSWRQLCFIIIYENGMVRVNKFALSARTFVIMRKVLRRDRSPFIPIEISVCRNKTHQIFACDTDASNHYRIQCETNQTGAVIGPGVAGVVFHRCIKAGPFKFYRIVNLRRDLLINSRVLSGDKSRCCRDNCKVQIVLWFHVPTYDVAGN